MSRIRCCPGHEAFFEFHVSHWLGTPTGGAPILPEAEKLRGSSVACIYGEDDDDSICPELAPGDFSVVKLAGGHHFGGDYENLARIILEGLPRAAVPQSVALGLNLVRAPNVYAQALTRLH
jgi:type IV secretory pathway VirJ component